MIIVVFFNILLITPRYCGSLGSLDDKKYTARKRNPFCPISIQKVCKMAVRNVAYQHLAKHCNVHFYGTITAQSVKNGRCV